MRIVPVFFLLFIITRSFGQSRQDSLKIFEGKAKTYLERTYSRQSFDSAFTKWNGVVFLDIQDIYYKKDKALSDKIIVLNKLRKDYHIFYASHKDFSVVKFDDENISDESENPTMYFKYTFRETVKGKDNISSSYLYFIFDKELSEWTIWDYRISEVLGEPKRWLK